MAKELPFDVDDFREHFVELEDPRSHINQRHPFESVLMICVMAVLAGAIGPTSITQWAKHKLEWLKTLMHLPHGLPQKDVYRRILCSLPPAAFQACFESWLTRLLEHAREVHEVQGSQPLHLAIDGKTLRRSHDKSKGLGSLHCVSVWAGQYGLTLAQVACEEKSNEITAIPEALKLIPLKNSIITIDAIGTQKEIAKQIIKGEGDYVLALKGNHEKLHQAVIEYVDQQQEKNFRGAKARKYVTEETGHGREEQRIYVQLPVPEELPGKNDWAGLKTIGVAMLKSTSNGKTTTDIRYYISSLELGVKLFAKVVRGHWRIESCHWSLDVAFREDDLRHRERNLVENFAWLNRFALSLYKQHPSKSSLIGKRRQCGWSEQFLLEVLTGKST